MLKHLLLATVLMTSQVYAKDAKTTKAKTAKVAKVAEQKLEIDPAASKVVYLGKKVTGQHTGEVKVQSGNLTFAGDVLKGAEVVIDMTTINNTDLTDKEYNKKFVDHMNSDDFFATSKFKTATLVVKDVKKVKDNTYTLTGDLTIKGKTAPVTFDADVTKAGATAMIKFDRTKYDIKYGSGQFFQGLGDKMINDDVQLTVTLVTKQ
jgi:polyisoprenoid-binding protein YceI